MFKKYFKDRIIAAKSAFDALKSETATHVYQSLQYQYIFQQQSQSLYAALDITINELEFLSSTDAGDYELTHEVTATDPVFVDTNAKIIYEFLLNNTNVTLIYANTVKYISGNQDKNLLMVATAENFPVSSKEFENIVLALTTE